MLPDNVREERSGWRDQDISGRHRMWGFNCPCVDLDFLVVEYNLGKPVALIEYKHKGAKEPVLDHATYRALTILANGYKDKPLPFLISFYRKDIWAFKIIPVNEEAKKWFKQNEVLTERDFVTRLYKMRNIVLEDNILPHLFTKLPNLEKSNDAPQAA